MPKPLLMHRPSGLYVRFRGPSDLRVYVGSRFLVRSLRGYQGDDARLVAAVLAVSLSKAFDALRRGTCMVDVKKLQEGFRRRVDPAEPGDVGVQANGLPNWVAKGFKIGNVEFGEIQVDGPADTDELLKFARGLIAEQASAAPTQPSAAAPVAPALVEPVEESPLLSEAIRSHLGDMTRRKLTDDTISESRHSLRLVRATTGDIRVRLIKVDHVRKFLDEVRWWPALAGVKPQRPGHRVRYRSHGCL